jgi:hypothetical protein
MIIDAQGDPLRVLCDHISDPLKIILCKADLKSGI